MASEIESSGEAVVAPVPGAVRFVSIADAAKRIGVSSKFIEKCLYESDTPLPSIKLGRRRLIDVSVLDEWVLAHAA